MSHQSVIPNFRDKLHNANFPIFFVFSDDKFDASLCHGGNDSKNSTLRHPVVPNFRDFHLNSNYTCIRINNNNFL